MSLNDDPRNASNQSPNEADPTAANVGPLTGIRVLELGSFIAGPFAGQLLGDYGADVIKIESPSIGDPMRRWGEVEDGEGVWWSSIARNKRSVEIDLRDPRGREVVRRLIREVDIVIENFRPGRLVDWELDYPTLSAIHPGLIMVHISGFGQDGPRSADAGFGSIGEAIGGIRHLTGDPDRPSARCGISLGDSLAAMFAVIGAMGALFHRERTGVGQEIDVALYESVFALMESTLADYEATGKIRTRSGGVLPGVAPSNVYPTADGHEVLIAANADSVFARLCAEMGQPELVVDDRFASHGSRGAHMAEIDAIIGGWTVSMTADELLKRLESAAIPSGKIYTAPDILGDPHYLARGVIEQIVTAAGATRSFPGVVPRFSATPGKVRTPGPALGRDTYDVVRSLADLDDAEWIELNADGVLESTSSAPHGRGGVETPIESDSDDGSGGR